MSAININNFDDIEEYSSATFSNVEEYVRAVDAGDVDAVKKLISPGEADVDAQFYLFSMKYNAIHFTLLSYAVKKGQLEIVKALLDAGADPNVCNAYNQCPLHFAGKAGESGKAIAELLIAKGAEIDPRARYTDPVLVEAVKAGNAGVVEVLLKAGVNPNMRTQNARGDWTQITPLYLAVKQDSLPIIKLLVEHGAPVNPQMYRAHSSSMSSLIQAKSLLIMAILKPSSETRDAIVRYLIEKGADVNAPHEGREKVWYPAEIVADMGDDKLLREFIRHDAKIRLEMLGPKGKATLEKAQRMIDRFTLAAIHSTGKHAAATRRLKERIEAAGGEEAYNKMPRNKYSTAAAAAGKGGARRRTTRRAKKHRGNK